MRSGKPRQPSVWTSSNPIETEQNAARRRELRRLITPFTLRRLKQSVLTELPAKIEDMRTCRLSDDQVKLYRDAVEKRGSNFLEVLQNDGQPVPYMHIFALLNLHKQICDHPALVEKDIENYDCLRSGKWDLFCELLVESLDRVVKEDDPGLLKSFTREELVELMELPV